MLFALDTAHMSPQNKTVNSRPPPLTVDMDKSGDSCLQGDNFILDVCHILFGNFKVITDL